MHVGIVKKFGEQKLFQKYFSFNDFASNCCCALLVAEVDAQITIIDGLLFISIYWMNLTGDILVPCFTWTQDPEWSFVLTHSTSYLNLFVFAVAQLFALIYWFFLHCLVRRNACSFLTEGRPRPSWHSKQHTEKKKYSKICGSWMCNKRLVSFWERIFQCFNLFNGNVQRNRNWVAGPTRRWRMACKQTRGRSYWSMNMQTQMKMKTNIQLILVVFFRQPLCDFVFVNMFLFKVIVL